MTRNDIKAQFPDATSEQINALLDIHSTDIGRAANKAQTTQEQLENQVKSLNEQIASLTEQVNTLNTTVAEKENSLKSLTAKYDGDVKGLNDQLTAVKARATAADELDKKIEQLTKDVADRDATIAKNNKQYRIKDELRNSQAKYIDVIWPLLNLDNIKETDGKIEGLTEQVQALQQTYPDLFNSGTQRGGFAGSPDVGNGTSVNDVVNQAIRSMSNRH